MNIESRKLLQNLSVGRVALRKKPQEAALLPLVPGHPFEISHIAMNARDLIERLGFERFYGAVYFHGEVESGEIFGVAILEGASLTGALFVENSSQWLGAPAWQKLSALKTLPQCLILQVETPLLEAYSALLQSENAPAVSADARKIAQAASDFHAQKTTGALRVSSEGSTYVQFFHAGTSLGLYAIGADERLTKQGDSLEDAALSRRVKLEVWTRQAVALWSSETPFDAASTMALARLLSTGFELGVNLMPQAMARALWSRSVASQEPEMPFLAALSDQRTLDLPSSRRLMAFKKVLRDARVTPETLARGVSQIADAFLLPIGESVGRELFAKQAAKAFSAPDSALLRSLGVSCACLDLEENAEHGASKGRVLDAIAGARYASAPRRSRTSVSTYDF